jgi:arabinan endo-1,5-alpha-L-arabinosidase
VEASCIVYLKESGYYYLSLSYGFLSKDYNIREGRSRNVEGPYLDARGNDLADLVPGREGELGVKILGAIPLPPARGIRFNRPNNTRPPATTAF